MLLKLTPATAKGMALKRGIKLHGERFNLRETEDVKGEKQEARGFASSFLLLAIISSAQIF